MGMKKNQLLLHRKTWMNPMVGSDRREIYSMIPLMEISKTGKTTLQWREVTIAY